MSELARISTSIGALQKGVRVSSLQGEVIEQMERSLGLSAQQLEKIRRRRILDAIRFDMMEARFESIKDAHKRTFEWLFKPDDHPELYKLAARCKGIFHIAGKPGSGKSTLMRFLTENAATGRILKEWSGGLEVITAKFFFRIAGTKLQRSFDGLCSTLLHTILLNVSEFIPMYFPQEWEDSGLFDPSAKFRQDNKTIQRVLEATLADPKLFHNRKVVFMIDGLDELEGDHRQMVQKLGDWSQANDNLKICVSCREWNLFETEFAKHPRLRLQDLTRPDMLQAAEDRIVQHPKDIELQISPNISRLFIGRLVDKSENVFLWTTLVVGIMEQGLERECYHSSLSRQGY
ncbi:hypothetical protein BX600DRAFT_481453 [Xylariales sp. PMI_506]|nr:hypothetical protein BX600DRAFT_481453 [Xylariales sp. PMI_506]